MGHRVVWRKPKWFHTRCKDDLHLVDDDSLSYCCTSQHTGCGFLAVEIVLFYTYVKVKPCAVFLFQQSGPDYKIPGTQLLFY